jgi:CheY-like chemotaxis protein
MINQLTEVETILFVDDEPNTALTLSRAISQLSPTLDVISATNGKTALERVKDGAVDLLITDMMMPEMKGLELIEAENTPGDINPTILIMMSGIAGERPAIESG